MPLMFIYLTISNVLKRFKVLWIVLRPILLSFNLSWISFEFKCSKCNSIIDIKSKDINLQCLELKNKAEMEKDLDIYDIDIIFTGLCSKCKEEFRWQDQQKLEQ